MEINRKRVARRIVSGLVAGAVALGGLAISGGTASARTPSSPTTNRIAGGDRYETAVALARHQIGTGNPDQGLVIASGENPYDALAGAVLTTNSRPMLLVRKDSIPTAVADFLADYKSALRDSSQAPKVYVLGGENAISADTLDAITAAVVSTGDLTPPTVTRLSGDDRYATANAIASVAAIMDASDYLIIVNGENDKWADALSAGALSSEKEWPIVTTTGQALQASAKATIDAYLALPGSVKQFVIIGGPASVGQPIIDYLIGTKSVKPANVRVIAGADRYQTSFLVNAYMLNENATYGLPEALAGTTTQNTGDIVALVSGSAPWDALAAAGWAAKTNAHIQLTNKVGGNANVSALAATLPSVRGGKTLYVIGGREAVADTAKTAYVAAATSENLTSTLSGCTVGSKVLTLELSGKLTSHERGTLNLISSANLGARFKVNGVAQTTVNVVNYVAYGTTSAHKTFDIELSSALALGATVEFTGWTEGVSPSTAIRSIASSSCSAALDTTPPVITLRAVSGSAAPALGNVTTSVGAKLFVSSNEPISIGGVTYNAWSSAGSDEGYLYASANPVTVSAVGISENATVAALNSSHTEWLISFDHTDDVKTVFGYSAGGTVVEIDRYAITDGSGNYPSTNPTVNVGLADTTKPTLSVAAVDCSAATNASITSGSLTLSAVGSGSGGTQTGTKGMGYTLTITNQRGLLSPTVAVDTAGKTIAVTADTAYHTPNDVLTVMRNTGQAGDWTVTASTTTLTATVVAARATGGTDDCLITVSGSEPFHIDSDGVTVTVEGLSAGYVTKWSTTPDADWVAGTNPGASGVTDNGAAVTGALISINTSVRGTATLTFAIDATGVHDTAGNIVVTPVNFTL